MIPRLLTQHSPLFAEKDGEWEYVIYEQQPPFGPVFLPVEQRVPQSARFYRVIGRDAGGAVLADLHAFYQLTRSEGALYTRQDR